MPLRLKARHFFYTAAVSSLMLYQNCAQAPDTSSNTLMSYESSLPFAYKATIDTLSYMSCSEMTAATYEPRAYYTFRAGAYSSATGGLGFTQAFRDATKYYDTISRAQALAGSENNSATTLNLSIRATGNFQSIWQTDKVTVGEEVDAFLPPLDSDPIAGPLAGVPAGGQLNYFPGSQDQRLLEASLRYLKAENVANLTRNNLDSRVSLLVAGYSSTPDLTNQVLRSPFNVLLPDGSTMVPAIPVPPPGHDSETNSIFGTGYMVNFSLPVGYSSGDRRVLSSVSGVQELDLQSGSVVGSSWDCSTNYQFMVVRPEDKAANRVICNAGVDRYSNTTQQAALAAVRRVLRVEDWYVDMDHHCVMPKGSGDYCYGTTIGGRQIMYGYTACVDSATQLCPHFVSVCLRH